MVFWSTVRLSKLAVVVIALRSLKRSFCFWHIFVDSFGFSYDFGYNSASLTVSASASQSAVDSGAPERWLRSISCWLCAAANGLRTRDRKERGRERKVETLCKNAHAPRQFKHARDFGELSLFSALFLLLFCLLKVKLTDKVFGCLGKDNGKHIHTYHTYTYKYLNIIATSS